MAAEGDKPASSMMLKLEYSSSLKKDFKKMAKLPIPDIVEAGHMIKQL